MPHSLSDTALMTIVYTLISLSIDQVNVCGSLQNMCVYVCSVVLYPVASLAVVSR